MPASSVLIRSQLQSDLAPLVVLDKLVYYFGRMTDLEATMSPRVPDTHRVARRNEILDAALLCFSRSGLERATLRDISAQSGLSLGTIYHYFPTKALLIAGIQERDLANEDQELWDTAPDPSDIAWTEHYVRFTHDRLGDPRSFDANRVGAMLWAHALLDDETRLAQIASLRRSKDEVIRAVRAQQAVGLVDADLDAESAYHVILAMVIGLVAQKNWEPALDTAKAAAVVRALLTGRYISAAPDQGLAREEQ